MRCNFVIISTQTNTCATYKLFYYSEVVVYNIQNLNMFCYELWHLENVFCNPIFSAKPINYIYVTVYTIIEKGVFPHVIKRTNERFFHLRVLLVHSKVWTIRRCILLSTVYLSTVCYVIFGKSYLNGLTASYTECDIQINPPMWNQIKTL